MKVFDSWPLWNLVLNYCRAYCSVTFPKSRSPRCLQFLGIKNTTHYFHYLMSENYKKAMYHGVTQTAKQLSCHSAEFLCIMYSNCCSYFWGTFILKSDHHISVMLLIMFGSKQDFMIFSFGFGFLLGSCLSNLDH